MFCARYEAPRPLRPFACVRDTHARSRLDIARIHHDASILQPQTSLRPQRLPAEPPTDPKRLGESRRANNITRAANEYGGWSMFGFACDIQHVVHPIGEVHVESAGRTKHGRCARRLPEPGVRRAVFGSCVGFGLGDHERHLLARHYAHEVLTQEFASDYHRVSIEKCRTENLSHPPIVPNALDNTAPVAAPFLFC